MKAWYWLVNSRSPKIGDQDFATFDFWRVFFDQQVSRVPVKSVKTQQIISGSFSISKVAEPPTLSFDLARYTKAAHTLLKDQRVQ